jgi:hypothetical protein
MRNKHGDVWGHSTSLFKKNGKRGGGVATGKLNLCLSVSLKECMPECMMCICMDSYYHLCSMYLVLFLFVMLCPGSDEVSRFS